MSKSSLEIKVGLFVLICLLLLAGLMLQFSKGTTFFRPTYNIKLNASNIGGLRAQASVLMAGVQIGTVSKTELSPGGTNVVITLRIYKEFTIHHGARFVIEQSGFLGDQYVAIYQDLSTAETLDPGEEVRAQEPFNLQEVARSARDFITHIDETAKKLNEAIADVRRDVLNQQTLSNLSVSASNLRSVSDKALDTMDSLNLLISSNQAPASAAVSNLVLFSEQLNQTAASAQAIVTNNSAQIASAVGNLRAASEQVTNLLAEVNAGHGLAGTLIKNDALGQHVSLIASNLSVTSSNLNQLGLWRVIWGPPHHYDPSPLGRHPAK